MQNARPRGRQPLSDRGGESSLVDTYLDEIGRHPLLTAEEERQLAQRMETGRRAAEELGCSEVMPEERRAELVQDVAVGQQARRRFVECNLRLVVAVARTYRSSGLAFLDLVQEGNIGLVRAVERFDHRRGFRFSTYGGWVIRQSITRAIANTGRTIRLPVRAGEVKARVERARRELEAAGGRPPADSELAAFLGMKTVEVHDALQWGTQPLSLFDLARCDGRSCADVIPDASSAPVADQALSWAVAEEVHRILSRLGQRERQVVALRFGLDCGEKRTLTAVAETLGLTAQTVAGIQNTAMAKLRGAAGSRGLRDLLAS